MSTENAYKIKPLKIGNNPASVTLRAIAYAKYLVVGLIGTASALMKIRGHNNSALILGALGILGGPPVIALSMWERDLAKLIDIRSLLASKDMTALQAVINRTRKIKNMLDGYESWSEVPMDVRNSVANYFDQYYKTMTDLEMALQTAEIRAREQARLEAEESKNKPLAAAASYWNMRFSGDI